jgi:hypothetical protein
MRTPAERAKWALEGSNLRPSPCKGLFSHSASNCRDLARPVPAGQTRYTVLRRPSSFGVIREKWRQKWRQGTHANQEVPTKRGTRKATR